MVHFLDRGLGLVLDYSLRPDPVYCSRCSGLGCYTSIAKLGLQAALFRSVHTELHRRLVWAIIRYVVLLHGIFVYMEVIPSVSSTRYVGCQSS